MQLPKLQAQEALKKQQAAAARAKQAAVGGKAQRSCSLEREMTAARDASEAMYADARDGVEKKEAKARVKQAAVVAAAQQSTAAQHVSEQAQSRPPAESPAPTASGAGGVHAAASTEARTAIPQPSAASSAKNAASDAAQAGLHATSSRPSIRHFQEYLLQNLLQGHNPTQL